MVRISLVLDRGTMNRSLLCRFSICVYLCLSVTNFVSFRGLSRPSGRTNLTSNRVRVLSATIMCQPSPQPTVLPACSTARLGSLVEANRFRNIVNSIRGWILRRVNLALFGRITIRRRICHSPWKELLCIVDCTQPTGVINSSSQGPAPARGRTSPEEDRRDPACKEPTPVPALPHPHGGRIAINRPDAVACEDRDHPRVLMALSGGERYGVEVALITAIEETEPAEPAGSNL